MANTLDPFNHTMQSPIGTRTRARRHTSGFTIIEAVVVMAILLMGLLAMTSTSVTVHSLRESDRERRLASSAMNSVVEDVKRISAAQIGTDPSWSTNFVAAYEAGGIPGPAFPVRGLTPQAGQAAVCTVQVITDETVTDAELGVELGMPRDLDNDGNVDNNDVEGSASLLPVIVRAQWTGSAGNRTLVQGFFVLGF